MIKDNLSETDQMKQRIALAFDALAQPDSVRIRALENVLVGRALAESGRRQQKRTHLWWLAGLLLLGTAAAGWWAGKTYFADIAESEKQGISENLNRLPPQNVDGEAPNEAGQGKLQSDQQAPPRSPVIFRR